jgi:hypothetical protein
MFEYEQAMLYIIKKFPSLQSIVLENDGFGIPTRSIEEASLWANVISNSSS